MSLIGTRLVGLIVRNLIFFMCVLFGLVLNFVILRLSGRSFPFSPTFKASKMKVY